MPGHPGACGLCRLTSLQGNSFPCFRLRVGSCVLPAADVAPAPACRRAQLSVFKSMVVGGGGGHMARAASRGSPPPFLLKGASIPLWPGGLFSVTLNHAGLSLGGHLPAFSRWLHRLAPQGTRKYSHSDFYQQLDQGSLGFFCHASRRSPSLFPFLYSVSASCGCLSKPSQTLGLKIRQIYHLTLVGGQKSELGLR